MKILLYAGLIIFLFLGLPAYGNQALRDDPEDTLSAEFHDDHIDLSDGRELQFVKYQLPHVGSQLVMTAPPKAKITLRYADGTELQIGKVPFVYKVPQERIHENFWLIVDEGGPALTWQLEFKHESSFSIEISSEE